MSLFTEMCEILPQIDCEEMVSEELTYLPEDSLVNLTALLVNALRQMMSGICGESVQDCFATFTPDGRCLKTYRGYSQVNLDGSFDEFSGRWPRHGMMLSGQLMELPILGRRTKGIGFSLWPTPTVPNGGRQPKGGMSMTGMTPDGIKRQVDLQYAVRHWPTPNVCGNYNRKGASSHSGDGLATAVKNWPTPKGSCAHGAGIHGQGGQDLQTTVKMWGTHTATGAVRSKEFQRYSMTPVEFAQGSGGQLNADWVECLMNFSIGWTDIDCETPQDWPGWPAPLHKGNWPTPQCFDATCGDLKGKEYTGESKHAMKLGNCINAEIGQYPYEPPRVITGQKHRTKRLKCCGNTVVPLQIYPVFATIVEIEYVGGFDDVDIDSGGVRVQALRS